MRKIKITLKHEDGREDSAPSMMDFAKKYNLYANQLCMLVNGKELFVKGWFIPTELEKPIKLLDDQDKEYFVKCIPQFIIDNSIPKKDAKKLFLREDYHIAGFRKEGTEKKVLEKKPLYYFKSPKNKINVVKSIYQLSKKYPDLNDQSIRNFVRGKTSKKDYKGWTLVDYK